MDGKFMLEDANGHTGRYEHPAWLVPVHDRSNPLSPLWANRARGPTRPDILTVPTMREGPRSRCHDKANCIYEVKFTHESLFADTIGAASLQHGALAGCLRERGCKVVSHVLVVESMSAVPVLTLQTLRKCFQAARHGTVGGAAGRAADRLADQVADDLHDIAARCGANMCQALARSAAAAAGEAGGAAEGGRGLAGRAGTAERGGAAGGRRSGTLARAAPNPGRRGGAAGHGRVDVRRDSGRWSTVAHFGPEVTDAHAWCVR